MRMPWCFSCVRCELGCHCISHLFSVPPYFRVTECEIRHPRCWYALVVLVRSIGGTQTVCVLCMFEMPKHVLLYALYCYVQMYKSIEIGWPKIRGDGRQNRLYITQKIKILKGLYNCSWEEKNIFTMNDRSGSRYVFFLQEEKSCGKISLKSKLLFLNISSHTHAHQQQIRIQGAANKR